ncbi:MAG: hypothetical protein IJ033_03795 [Clostridia bacterium]|nr:hypothetical protein [Clostridia bacterium]
MEEKSILSVLTPGQARIVDMHGYDFLAANGYAAAGAQDSRQVRSLLRKALKERGEVLITKEVRQEENFMVWFELRRKKGNILRAQSSSIKIKVEV